MCVVKWVWQWGHGQPRELLHHRQNLEEPPERNVGNNLNCILLKKNCTSTCIKRARKTFFRALATEKRGGAQPEAHRRRRDLQPTGRARGIKSYSEEPWGRGFSEGLTGASMWQGLQAWHGQGQGGNLHSEVSSKEPDLSVVMHSIVEPSILIDRVT